MPGMKQPEQIPGGQVKRTHERNRWRLDLVRAGAAAVLLGGLFALFYFVVLPGGGSGDAPVAIRVDTPPGPSGSSPGIHPGDLARDFDAGNLDALRFRLSDLRGRPVVINFWATWCTSCLAEMPTLEEQRQRHEADGLTILAVNVGESLDGARGFIDALELFEFAIAMDPDLTISDMYAVQGLPHSVFIDRNGVIQAEYRGQLDEDTMGGYVRAAIEASPGAPAPIRPRFITTVPREHVLDVIEEGAGSVRLVSRSLRCDDDYCAEPVADAVAGSAGVTSAQLRSGAVPPELSVTFAPAAITLEQVVAIAAEALGADPDPLYTRELEVRYVGAEP